MIKALAFFICYNLIMIIIAVNEMTNKKIAFTNNTTARNRLRLNRDIDEVLILGKYDLGFPDTNIKTTEQTSKDGLIIDNIKYTKRDLQFNTNFLSSSELHISQQRQRLAGIINSQQMTIRLEFYRNNDESSKDQLFYLRNVVGRISYESSDGQRLTSSQNCLLEFTAYKPLFEKPVKSQTFQNAIAGQGMEYPIHYPFTYSSTLGVLGEITNHGDVPTPFIADFSGTLNSASLQLINKISSTNFEVEKEIKFKQGIIIPETDKLIVDTDTRTAEINGVNAFEKLDPDTRFFNLKSGQNELRFLSGQSTADNKVKIEWIEKYLSI